MKMGERIAAALLAIPLAACIAAGEAPRVLWVAVAGLIAPAAGPLLLGAARRLVAYRRLRAIRLSDVDGMSGAEFEDYVGRLLERQGYRIERIGGSGDLGVDLVATYRETRWAIQVKRSARPVSRRAVSDAVAGARHYDCDAAMVVTSSGFTPGAVELAGSTGCELVDREELTEWILAAGGR